MTYHSKKLSYDSATKAQIKFCADTKTYLVYGHYTSNNVLFYVGHGTAKRPRQHYYGSRNPQWEEIYNNNEKIIVKIFDYGLSKNDAIILEEFLLIHFEGQLVSEQIRTKFKYQYVSIFKKNGDLVHERISFETALRVLNTNICSLARTLDGRRKTLYKFIIRTVD